jgi:hypothetical protein
MTPRRFSLFGQATQKVKSLVRERRGLETVFLGHDGKGQKAAGGANEGCATAGSN